MFIHYLWQEHPTIILGILAVLDIFLMVYLVMNIEVAIYGDVAKNEEEIEEMLNLQYQQAQQAAQQQEQQEQQAQAQVQFATTQISEVKTVIDGEVSSKLTSNGGQAFPDSQTVKYVAPVKTDLSVPKPFSQKVDIAKVALVCVCFIGTTLGIINLFSLRKNTEDLIVNGQVVAIDGISIDDKVKLMELGKKLDPTANLPGSKPKVKVAVRGKDGKIAQTEVELMGYNPTPENKLAK
jgi:hypothetical protein